MEARFKVVYDDLPAIEVLRHEADDRGNVFTLLTPIEHCQLKIPAGFESDGASVPRAFWGLVFPAEDMKAMFAAMVHDFIYRTHPTGWTKKLADEEFRQLLERCKVPAKRAYFAYLGVRLFGGPSWRAGGAS